MAQTLFGPGYGTYGPADIYQKNPVQGPGLGRFGSQDLFRQSGSVLGASTGPTGQVAAPAPSGGGQPEPQGPSAEEIARQQIDADYNAALSQLSGQEQTLGEQKTQAISEAQTAFAPARTQLQNEQATREADIAKETTNVQNTATNAISEARRIFNDVQQQNIAQLAGAGISSSSVAEALAERLGRETAQRLFSVAQTRDQAVGALDEEKRRVQAYVQERMTNLEQQLTNTITNIQNQFQQGLREINNQRNLAANAKASANRDLLMQVRQAQDVAKAQAQQFAQQLAAFQVEKARSLQEAQQLIVNIPDAVFGDYSGNPFSLKAGSTRQAPTGIYYGVQSEKDRQLQPYGVGGI